MRSAHIGSQAIFLDLKIDMDGAAEETGHCYSLELHANGAFLSHLSQLKVSLMSGQQLPLFYQLHPLWACRLPQALRGGQCKTSESSDQLP